MPHPIIHLLSLSVLLKFTRVFYLNFFNTGSGTLRRASCLFTLFPDLPPLLSSIFISNGQMYVRIIFVVTKGRPSRGQEVFVSICFIPLELFSSLGHDYTTLFWGSDSFCILGCMTGLYGTTGFYKLSKFELFCFCFYTKWDGMMAF